MPRVSSESSQDRWERCAARANSDLRACSLDARYDPPRLRECERDYQRATRRCDQEAVRGLPGPALVRPTAHQAEHPATRQLNEERMQRGDRPILPDAWNNPRVRANVPWIQEQEERFERASRMAEQVGVSPPDKNIVPLPFPAKAGFHGSFRGDNLMDYWCNHFERMHKYWVLEFPGSASRSEREALEALGFDVPQFLTEFKPFVAWRGPVTQPQDPRVALRQERAPTRTTRPRERTAPQPRSTRTDPRPTLQDRMLERPRRMGIQTQIVHRVRESMEAQSNNIWRNSAGGFTMRFPSGEVRRVEASQVPAHIQSRAGPVPSWDTRKCGSVGWGAGGYLETARCGCNSGHCGRVF
jgi:hypothetical protein